MADASGAGQKLTGFGNKHFAFLRCALLSDLDPHGQKLYLAGGFKARSGLCVFNANQEVAISNRKDAMQIVDEQIFNKPLRIEVVSKMLGVQTEECKNCRLIFEEVGLKSQFHNQEINQYPDDIKEEVLRLSDWIRDLVQRYPNTVQFKIIDAMTPLGLYKMLRHRIRRFPSFIIDKQQTYSGWDTKALESIINQYLQSRHT